jgi:hypothetical protein
MARYNELPVLKICIHAVRHVRAAACRTTDKFGSLNQQQGVEKYCW